jgi:F-type H+-transporting ATPase subunit gamma
MAGLQQLRKRLKSIRSTGQLAEAMRTASTIKYTRVSKARAEFTPYAEGSAAMLSQLGRFGICREADNVKTQNCLVLFGSNRGLCGGFNGELFRFLDTVLAEEKEKPLLISCSRKASAYCREHGLEFEEQALSDVPTYEETHALCERLSTLYTTGEVNAVRLVYQSYQNMLMQTPVDRQILPDPDIHEGENTDGILYLPSSAAIGSRLAVTCLNNEVFAVALDNASGAQAATLMAMRSACDNAAKSAASLETTINRRRQAEVTASVIEIASGNLQQGE